MFDDVIDVCFPFIYVAGHKSSQKSWFEFLSSRIKAPMIRVGTNNTNEWYFSSKYQTLELEKRNKKLQSKEENIEIQI